MLRETKLYPLQIVSDHQIALHYTIVTYYDVITFITSDDEMYWSRGEIETEKPREEWNPTNRSEQRATIRRHLRTV